MYAVGDDPEIYLLTSAKRAPYVLPALLSLVTLDQLATICIKMS